MSMTPEEWMTKNHACLIAEVNVIKTKVRLHMENQGMIPPASNSAELLRNAKDESTRCHEEINDNSRFRILRDTFRLTPFEYELLVLAVGLEIDNELSSLIYEVNGNKEEYLPTLSFVLGAFEDAHWSALSPQGALRYWQLIQLNKKDILTSSTFSADERILHFLTGIQAMDNRLSPYLNAIGSRQELVDSHKEIARQIEARLSGIKDRDRPPMIQLMGKSVEDQKAIFSSVASTFGLLAFSLPIELLPASFRELADFFKLWSREAILNKYILCIEAAGLEEMEKNRQDLLERALDKVQGIVVICTEHRFKRLHRDIEILQIEKPLRSEQEELWKKHLGDIGSTLNGTLGNIVAQFNLDSYTIAEVAAKAKSQKTQATSEVNDMESFYRFLWKSCCKHTRPDLSNLAQRIEPIATWEDLILPDAQLETLRNICTQVQHRQQVYHEWGFASTSNRGLGISAMFAGESGTGKTMASEVIANALDLDLYRIDLSQIISKYIGETEKNLKSIFDAAEDSGAILLFDEADALFGKRSEVKDSHDRNANIEVSYLLQKMEAYRGLAILTTNMKSALDTAFLRRIRFVIQFPFPDAEMRYRIWTKVFPNQTPIDALDFKRLANLNVAGGNIKNIAMNAAFSAARKENPISMLDLQQAAKSEYMKLEKNMSPSESLI